MEVLALPVLRPKVARKPPQAPQRMVLPAALVGRTPTVAWATTAVRDRAAVAAVAATQAARPTRGLAVAAVRAGRFCSAQTQASLETALRASLPQPEQMGRTRLTCTMAELALLVEVGPPLRAFPAASAASPEPEVAVAGLGMLALLQAVAVPVVRALSL